MLLCRYLLGLKVAVPANPTPPILTSSRGRSHSTSSCALAACKMVAAAASADMQSEAFKRLYPEEFYARFIAEGVRPDGRPLGRPRPVSVGLGSITTADASAHVKVLVR